MQFRLKKPSAWRIRLREALTTLSYKALYVFAIMITRCMIRQVAAKAQILPKGHILSDH